MAEPLDPDGALRLFWPDDLYILGGRRQLLALRDAIDEALAGRQGIAAGPRSEGERRAVIVQMVLTPEELRPTPGPRETAPSRPVTVSVTVSRHGSGVVPIARRRPGGACL